MSGAALLAAAAGLAGTVDRVEGDWLVVEWGDGTSSELPSVLLPGAREGLAIVLLPLEATASPAVVAVPSPAHLPDDLDLSGPWSPDLAGPPLLPSRPGGSPPVRAPGAPAPLPNPGGLSPTTAAAAASAASR